LNTRYEQTCARVAGSASKRVRVSVGRLTSSAFRMSADYRVPKQ
jgi:hypothetical protein